MRCSSYEIIAFKILADCLNEGVSELLNQNKSPKRKFGQLDNRGSHFYVALFWTEALAKRSEFADEFSQLAKDLRANEVTNLIFSASQTQSYLIYH